MKKLFTFFLALIVSAGMMFAETINGIVYRLNTTKLTAEVTSNSKGYSGSVVVPENIVYQTKTYSVTSIGNYAFEDCTGLTSIDIPNSVTRIGYYAFAGCTGLTSVTIGKNVTSIGAGAFGSCTGLTEIIVIAENPIYSSEDGVLFDKDKSTLIQYLCGKQGEYTIPNSVTSIGEFAFSGCTGLTSITIPNSVTSIGESAFSHCKSLTSVEIPNSVTNIGDLAFVECSGLSSIEIPNSVISIGNQAFNGCSGLTSVTIPNSVTSIGEDAFWGWTNLTSVNWGPSLSFFPATNKSLITQFTFDADSIPASFCQELTALDSLTIGENVKYIEAEAFVNCSQLSSVVWKAKNCSDFTSRYTTPFTNNNYKNLLKKQIKSFAFSEGVENIPAYLFYLSGDALTEPVVIPNSIKRIGQSAFSNCPVVTSINLPNGITSIGGYAFCNCTNCLDTTITIPETVTYVGEGAFSKLPKVDSVYWNAKKCQEGKSPFSNTVKAFIFGEDVEWIPDSVCCNLSLLTSITIPKKVTKIGARALIGCTKLKSVVWNAAQSDNFSSSSTPFYYDKQNDNTNFDLRTKITSFTFGNDVKVIPAYLCYGMRNLTSITVPKNVTGIETHAFDLCSGLKKVNITDIATWCSIAFNNSSANPLAVAKHLYLNGVEITDLVIPNGVTKIEKYAFYNCSGLTSVTCEALTPPSMGSSVFYNVQCSQIPLYVPAESVTAYKTANQWKEFSPILPIGFTGYTITFVNWNGEILLELPVEEGIVPEYTGATPTRSGTAEFTYTFTGWTPDIVAATKDATYTATYSATRKSYTITWLQDDGSLIDKTTVVYGQTPTHANPTKQETAEYKYIFAGWSPKIVAVTGDATYTAQYTAIPIEEKDITNCVEAAEAALSVSADNELYHNGKEYTIEGYVTAIVKAWNSTYNNISFWMADSKDGGRVIEAYRAVCNNRSDAPYLGDYVRVTGKLTKYGTIPEFAENCTFEILREGERESAEEIETSEVTATPTEEDGKVILEWPAVENADTYTITIAKNGEVVCTLVFDAEGRLISIAFAAPARDGKGRNVPAAEQSAKGWRYTVEGLDAGAEYTYTITAKKEDESVLFTQSINFTMPAPQGIDDINAATKSQKIVRDGKVYILRGEKTYTVTGLEIK